MAPTFPPVLDRLAEKAVMDTGGCWTFVGALTQGGYGQIWWKGANRLAHRVSYELHFGPAAAGLQLDHLCRNRACINPVHLEPVTSHENARRAGMPIAARQLAKTHCAHGHPFDEINTYVHPATGHRHCRECSRASKRRNSR
jgi:hypothetical protein